MKELKVDISRIDDFGVYKTDDGNEIQLSIDQIEALRMIYKTNDIAVKTDARKVKESTEKVIFNQLNVRKPVVEKKNKAKNFSLQKSSKINTFKNFSDIRNVVKKGKVFFIAGMVVFVSAVGGTTFLADNYKAAKEDLEMKNFKEEAMVASVSIGGAELTEQYMEAMEPKVEENKEQKRIIKNYSDVYSVKYDKVYSKIVELTDNFTSDEYLSGTITGVTCKDKQVQSDKEELLLLLTVRNIKQMPEKYGFTIEDIASPIKASDLGVENAFDYEKVICDDYHRKMDYYAGLFDLDRCVIHAVIQCESGYKSNRFVNDHNPAGLKEDNVFRIFDGDEEGLIEVCTELVKYRDMGATTISEIGKIHDPGEASAWTILVGEIYEDALLSQDLMFGEKTEDKQLIIR